VRELDPTSFDEAIARGPIVVDFWAPWCRPCLAVAPILEDLEAAAAGRVAFAKLNVDDHPEISGRYEVLSIPTVILFADGDVQQRVVGVRPRDHFEQAFASWLNGSGPSPTG
jgi:thioredoxin